MREQIFSWATLLTVVGVTGFILAGRKIWWSWYINLACQVLWFIYATVTEQYAFFVAAGLYTVVFGQNAYKWTREHFEKPKPVPIFHNPKFDYSLLYNDRKFGDGVVKAQTNLDDLIVKLVKTKRDANKPKSNLKHLVRPNYAVCLGVSPGIHPDCGVIAFPHHWHAWSLQEPTFSRMCENPECPEAGRCGNTCIDMF